MKWPFPLIRYILSNNHHSDIMHHGCIQMLTAILLSHHFWGYVSDAAIHLWHQMKENVPERSGENQPLWLWNHSLMGCYHCMLYAISLLIMGHCIISDVYHAWPVKGTVIHWMYFSKWQGQSLGSIWITGNSTGVQHGKWVQHQNIHQESGH